MGKRNRAAVVVLGDIGRSPRMQYHALSLARQVLVDVDIVAYGGTEPHISLLEHQSIHIHKIPQCPKIPRSFPRSMGRENDPNVTSFTTRVGSNIFLNQNRPALVVSSTSWTPDEDFGILLEAALMYDRRVAALLGEDDSITNEVIWDRIHEGKESLYPRLLFVITGKGPEKEKYEEKIRKLSLKRVAFRTMWLPAEDYPLLLGSADLGDCLHTSSSGLDLPMKVVDMFGCGLPVCAVSYSCITELIDPHKNGLLFSSSSELADELMMLFKGFPDGCDALSGMRSSLRARVSSVRWATGWEESAKPLIDKIISGRTGSLSD